MQLCFCGEYPHGSLGNTTAKMMEHDLASAVAEFAPVGVIVDCTELDYRWGDAICQIAMPLRRPDKSFIPACIVASGETAKALAPLIAPNWLLGFAGIQLVGSVDDACRILIARGG